SPTAAAVSVAPTSARLPCAPGAETVPAWYHAPRPKCRIPPCQSQIGQHRYRDSNPVSGLRIRRKPVGGGDRTQDPLATLCVTRRLRPADTMSAMGVAPVAGARRERKVVTVLFADLVGFT